jgi:glutathione S-transferase
MAPSLAARIMSYECGIHLNLIEVDPVTKRTPDGRNYLEISPLGLLPALRLHDGFLLTEDAAILQHLAASSTGLNLAPLSGLDLQRLHQWLDIVGTDLHEALSVLRVDEDAAGGIAAHIRAFVVASLDFLNEQLTDRQFLLNRFSIADAHLCSILWRPAPTRLALSLWPAINSYYDRVVNRPSVSRAIAEELALHDAELARHRSSRELSFGGFA